VAGFHYPSTRTVNSVSVNWALNRPLNGGKLILPLHLTGQQRIIIIIIIIIIMHGTMSMVLPS